MFLALPGKYSVEMSLVYQNKVEKLTDAVYFNAVTLNNKTIKVDDKIARQEFYTKLNETMRVLDGNKKLINVYQIKTEYIKQALHSSFANNTALQEKTMKLSKKLDDLEFSINGTKAKASWEEVPPEKMPVSVRLNEIIEALWQSTAKPTTTLKSSYEIVNTETVKISASLQQISDEIKELEAELDKIKAPYTPGRIMKN